MELSNIHILVLDRDAASARVIRDVLAKVGYKVSVASHESDALNLAAGELFNVVVKSFDAQRIDAVALMEKVRGITPDTQFIFLSDKGTIHTAVEAMRKGAFDYISKPISPALLLESVRKALDHQSLVAEDQQIKQRLRRSAAQHLQPLRLTQRLRQLQILAREPRGKPWRVIAHECF